MKKTYITPALLVQYVAIKETLLSGSLIIDGDKTATDDNGGWTKEERSDWSNIWDE